MCGVLFPCFSCQHQCNRLPREIHFGNELLCVEWDVKPYTLTHGCLVVPANELIGYGMCSVVHKSITFEYCLVFDIVIRVVVNTVYTAHNVFVI